MSIVNHNKEVPYQQDAFNCGQYTLLAARALMQGRKPDYRGFVEPAHERYAVERRDRKYKPGRRTWYGMRQHPETDAVVERFSKIKVKDHERMKKWKTKQMKGFK
jgi:hypothetical protein